MEHLRRRAPRLLAALFCCSGAVHLGRPQLFEPLIPSWIPRPRRVVYLSGLAELACAGGLLGRLRLARVASVLLLLVIFPGNVQMAVDADRERPGELTWAKMLAVGRLPLQIPLIWAAVQDPGSRPVPTMQGVLET